MQPYKYVRSMILPGQPQLKLETKSRNLILIIGRRGLDTGGGLHARARQGERQQHSRGTSASQLQPGPTHLSCLMTSASCRASLAALSAALRSLSAARRRSSRSALRVDASSIALADFASCARSAASSSSFAAAWFDRDNELSRSLKEGTTKSWKLPEGVRKGSERVVAITEGGIGGIDVALWGVGVLGVVF